MIFQIELTFLMLDFSINLKVENKSKKSNIIKLSDMVHVQNLKFNNKYYI
jgi:hypothetical protein